MDAAQFAKRAICQKDLFNFNPIITTGMQAARMLVISRIFHLILTPSGQPGPVANIIVCISSLSLIQEQIFKVFAVLHMLLFFRCFVFQAGLVLGPSLLCKIKKLQEFFIRSSSIEYYQLLTFNFRVIFLFLIGLDTDVPYMRRNLRLASTLAFEGIIACTLFGAASAIAILHLLK